MCSNPRTISDTVTIACRKCDDCLGSKISSWVARGVAESAAVSHTIAVTLTYRDVAHGLPDGAKVLTYKHIRTFLNSLQRAYKRHYGKTGEISFVVAGEYGSKKKRAHWHLILWSVEDLAALSKFRDAKQNEINYTIDQKILWDLWPHGLIYLQHPDAKGIRYVLKYAFKDQFTHVASRGSRRSKNAENYASGMFRMSKAPPLGDTFLHQKIKSWDARGVVPTSLNLKVPNLEGYWYPENRQRQLLANGIYQINQKRLAAVGKDCPQLSTLAASLMDAKDLKTLETIYYGSETKTNSDYLDRSYRVHEWRGLSHRDRIRHIEQQCNGITPCGRCAKTTSFEAIHKYASDQVEQISRYTSKTDGHNGAFAAADYHHQKSFKTNPFCQQLCWPHTSS